MSCNKNVLYVEPNYTNNKYNIEQAPSLEDYCVVVDLEVEVKSNRSISDKVADSKIIVCSFISKPKDNKGKVSFFDGKKVELDNKKVIKYLSTEPTEFGTFKDAIDNGTNECFGINSIDIMYNNYAIPEVTIKFTDIRGVSLFSPEELRHSSSLSSIGNGTIRDDVSGSFFKCFFTFPYPKFKLTVKGFYGEPVSYELCCSDFRANFDCNTGNFGATAKFVGYSFSLLNDVTMNALVVSPYSTYEGKKYWENNLPNRFVIDDGKGGNVKMLTFMEILEKLKNIKKDYDRLSQSDPLSVKIKEYSDIKNILTKASNCYYEYFNNVIKCINLYYQDIEISNNILINKDKYSFLIFNDTEDVKNEIIINNESLFNSLKDSIYELNKYYSCPFPKKAFIKFSPIELKKDEISRIDCLKNYGDKINKDLQNKYVFVYDGSELIDFLNSIKEIITNGINSTQKDIALKKDFYVEKNLGFRPTVENITKILMAHFETLIHCIYKSAKSIPKNRTINDLGITSTDINNSDNIATPYPRIDLHKVNSIEEGWIGDLPGGLDEEEAKLINGLLNGVNDVSSIINKAAKELKSMKGNDVVNSSIPIPITPLDIINDNKIYGENLDFDNISDVIGVIGLRCFSVLGLNDFTNYSELGESDAINFYKSYPKPSSLFINRLYGGTFNANLIYGILCNNKLYENEKINGRWSWDLNNISNNLKVITQKNYKDKYSLYTRNINGLEQNILPISNLDFSKIKKDLNNVNSLLLNENYFCTNSFFKKENHNIFFIDNDYEKYSKYEKLIQVNNEKLSHVKDMGIKFDYSKFIDDYYHNDNSFFGRLFSYENEKVIFSQGDGNYILPDKRPNERVKKSFINGEGIDNDFNEIINYDFDGNINRLTRSEGNIEDLDDVNIDSSTFTIKSFYGFIDGKVSDKISLFGQCEYYKQTDYVKSILFLMSFVKNDKIFSVDYGCLDYEKLINKLILNKNNFIYCPKILSLLIGGILWLSSLKENPFKFDENYITKDILNPYKNLINNYYNFRDEVICSFINYFKEWNEDENGFKAIRKEYELYSIKDNTVEEIFDFLNRYFDGSNNFSTFNENVNGYTYNSFEDYLMSNINDEFYKNYLSVKHYYNSLKLFNRETSIMNKMVTRLLLTPCVIVKPTKFIKMKEESIEISSFNYFDSFVLKLKELYKETSSEKTNEIKDVNSDNNIKISLYKYIKILWDRWLSGTSEEDWNLENFYKNWYFIDSFYNKVGQDILLNIVEFCNDVIYSQQEYTYSLLSFISKAYAKNRFAFHTVQNFMDLVNGENKINKINSLFKPIPYESIKFDNISKHPSFIVMYTNEYSSKLDIPNSSFKSDSFDINLDNEYLPKPISTKNANNGYKIPAFGVSYGKQYQSYFKNIDVSMDNPIVTEQSLKSQFLIASLNGKNGENGKNVITLGQDLYTIYSNNSYTCTVTMMGCAWIQPLMYFQLLNIPMFRGAYLIQKVTHRITPGNMETTFVGVRMASTETSKIKKSIYSKTNYETDYNEVVSEVKYNYASIDNNCDYKFFNPLSDIKNPSVDDDILNMSLIEYEKFIGNEFSDAVNSKIAEKGECTIIQLLSGVVEKEANGEDLLGKELVASVLFNRYMHYGKDFTQIFFGKQHEIGKSDELIITNIVKNIFIQSPMMIVGKITKVEEQVPIWDNGVLTNYVTSPKTITEHDVKSIDGYCTTKGYYALDKNKKGNDKEESYGYWQNKSKYILHHNGHVFVSGAYSYNKEHWKNEKVNNSNNSINLARNLFKCLKKTLQTVKINGKKELIENINRNTIYIKSDNKSVLKTVFDILLNTYFDYIDVLNWVSNDSSEEPVEIKVIVNNNKSFNKIIAVTDRNYKVVNECFYLNEYFYKSLQKHYNEINETNINSFKMTCTNFSKLFSDEIVNSSLIKKINSILGVEITDCPSIINNSLSKGYTWDGDTNYSSNLNVNTNKMNSYNPEGAANYASNNALESTKGLCATYVKNAMINGGNARLTSYPKSACAYSKYLPLWGFNEVYSGFSPITDGYSPLNGDIVVIAGRLDGKTSVDGHIQIYNDGKWCSDFKANTVYCYSDKGRPYKVFRWNRYIV